MCAYTPSALLAGHRDLRDARVVVVEAVEHRRRDDLADVRDSSRDRRVPVERLMRSTLVVVRHVLGQSSEQLMLAERDDVVRTLVPNRAIKRST